MEIQLQPVAYVSNTRKIPNDDHWQEISEIELADDIPTAALDHIETFSHLEVIYFFDQVQEQDIVYSGHPRGNKDYPNMGIFAQRKKNRPNRLGLCTVALLAHEGRRLTVKYLDAIDGTAILDIKPVFREFGPQSPVQQPAWVADLMKQYWI